MLAEGSALRRRVTEIPAEGRRAFLITAVAGRPVPDVALVAGAPAIVAARWLTAPVRLEIVHLPVFVEDLGREQRAVVELVNRLGLPAMLHDDSIEISLASGGDQYQLRGPTRIRSRHGRATFDSTRVVPGPGPASLGSGYVTLRFAAPDVAMVESGALLAGWAAAGVFLDSGVVNGQFVDPGSRTVRVTAGDVVHGTVHMHYRTNFQPAAVLMATVWNWGDRTRDFAPVHALAPRTARDTAGVHISIAAPTEPGRYWVAFVAALETEARFIASGTNWQLQVPTWHDGNDLVDMGDDKLRELNARGWTELDWDLGTSEDPVQQALNAQRALPRVGTYERRTLRGPRVVVGTVIWIEVEG